MILADRGEVAVENLHPGEDVVTLDHGIQTIRWIGKSETSARGEFAPIVFRSGALGNTRELRLSPQHRVLLRGWLAELYFGTNEILVPAKYLINDNSIRREPAEKVTYYHILLDGHEVIYSDGMLTESFFPGDQVIARDQKIRAELLAVFPELDNMAGLTKGLTARTVLNRREAVVLPVVN